MTADELKALRESAGLSQTELAKLVQMNRVSIVNYETGHTRISKPMALLFRLAIPAHKEGKLKLFRGKPIPK